MRCDEIACEMARYICTYTPFDAYIAFPRFDRVPSTELRVSFRPGTKVHSYICVIPETEAVSYDGERVRRESQRIMRALSEAYRSDA